MFVSGTSGEFLPKGGTAMFFQKEKGQGMVEYVLIIVLVAIVGLITWALLGDAITNTVQTIVNAI
jgi:pilus assembly protein Flp/PilA